MGKRNSLEIMARILSFCKEPQIKTRVYVWNESVMEDASEVSFSTQSIGLLEVHQSPTKCPTTQKGLGFLKKWKELTRLL